MTAPAYWPYVRVLLVTTALLMVPLVAMQFSEDVVWTLSDFIVAGVLLAGTGLTYELTARRGGGAVYRIATGLALGSALFLVWANLAVGLIGSENNPANLMYLGVLAVGLIGAILARLRPRGMASTLFAMAVAHGVVGAIALVMGLGGPASPPTEIIGVTGFFAALFVGAALLFRRAARQQEAGAA